MCLESSKQSYLLLTVLKESGPEGLGYSSVMHAMRELSREKFGSTFYVNLPVPTNALIRNAELDEEIEMKGGTWRITSKGKKIADFLQAKEIAELPEIA